MLSGRLLLMLVVMTATIAVRQPALAAETAAPVERTAWAQRLGAGIGVGVTRSLSRIGLMQRVALRIPSPRLSRADGHTTRPAAIAQPDPLRTCLPPPIA